MRRGNLKDSLELVGMAGIKKTAPVETPFFGNSVLF